MINGNIATALTALKFPAAIAGGAVGLAFIASAFGFGIKTPGAAMEDFKVDHNVTHAVIDTALIDIDQHMEVQMELTEALVRSDCIEQTKQNLERSGLIQKCSKLGIER